MGIVTDLQDTLKISEFLAQDIYTKYRYQAKNAKQRGIPFLLDIYEWWAWWQIDDRWSNRGIYKSNFVMARYNDTGPYVINNVYCATVTKNVQDKSPEVRRKASKIGNANFKTKPEYANYILWRKTSRYNNRAVVTPRGEFCSITMASEAYGINVKTATAWASTCKNEWSFKECVSSAH